MPGLLRGAIKKSLMTLKNLRKLDSFIELSQQFNEKQQQPVLSH